MDNIALVVMLNKKHLSGFKVFFESFLFFNKWFHYDVVILDIDLTLDIRNEIQLLFKDTTFKFKKINFDNYKNMNFSKTPDRLKVTFYKIDVFSLYEYSRLVFIDVDTVVLGNLSELFNCSEPFAAVKVYIEKIDILGEEFNSGVFVINNPNEKMYKEILDVAKQGFSLPEQKAMNIYFKDRVTFLNKSYNVEKRMEHTKNFKHILDNMKIVHYVAGKPWEENDREKGKYPKMEKIWKEWNEKDFN